MLAEPVLARAWQRSRTVQSQPEGFLEDALALVLETTDAWPRFVAHFRWSVPGGPFTVTAQDRITDAGPTSDCGSPTGERWCWS
jgi:hypothetical protein